MRFTPGGKVKETWWQGKRNVIGFLALPNFQCFPNWVRAISDN